MQDIAPEILKRIQSDFKEKCRNDKELGKLIDKIDSGKGDFRDAQSFAEHIGDRLGEAYVENLTEETLPNGRLYRNIAEKVITPTMEYNHELVCDASGKVEQALNEEAGIGLKVQVPELDQDRLNGLINHVSDHEDPFTAEKAQELADLTENFTHHVVDAFIEKNADAHYAAGLSPKIERDAMAECCAWCLDLAGTYDYPLKDRSVYQRHKDCRCVVDYHPGNGKVQNVHSKEWRDETDSDILEKRKTIGLEPLVDPAKVEARKKTEKSIEMSEERFKSIYLQYIDSATPNEGRFDIPDNRKMKNREEENMRLLYNTFGGNIEALPEIIQPGKKNPDYKWNGLLWEEQEPDKYTYNAVDKNVQEAIHQIRGNPGGIVLDVGNSTMEISEIKQISFNRLRRSSTFDCDFILIKEGKIVDIFRYKK